MLINICEHCYFFPRQKSALGFQLIRVRVSYLKVSYEIVTVTPK